MEIVSFDVPCDTWHLSVFLQPGKTAVDCSDKLIYSVLSPFGFPLVDFTEYPENFMTKPQISSQIAFNLSTSIFELKTEILKPKCGTWYLGIVLKDRYDDESIITNKDLQKSCYYFVGGGFTSQLVKEVDILSIHTPNFVQVDASTESPYPIIDGPNKLVAYYKFKAPHKISETFTMRITDCHYLNHTGVLDKCPIEIASRVGATPSPHRFSDNAYKNCLLGDAEYCKLDLWTISPDSNTWYYLAIWANETEPLFNMTISFEFDSCVEMEAKIPAHALQGVSLGQPNATSELTNGYVIEDEETWENTDNSSMKVNERCITAPRMTRLVLASQSYYTPIHFMSDSTGLLGNHLPIEEDQLIIVPLLVDDKFDYGGTLRLRLFLDRRTSEDFIVNVCLQWRYVPRMKKNDKCPFGYFETFTIRSAENSTSVIAVPYPKSGTWFMAFHSFCSPAGNCSNSKAYAGFEIFSTRCANAAPNQCGDYGSCSEVSTLGGRISACKCLGGYQGYGCTDGREAIPDALQRTLFVTLSNLAFLPAIILALNWGHFVPAAVYFYNMFFSSVSFLQLPNSKFVNPQFFSTFNSSTTGVTAIFTLIV